MASKKMLSPDNCKEMDPSNNLSLELDAPVEGVEPPGEAQSETTLSNDDWHFEEGPTKLCPDS